jgi:hypothetical protein
MSSFSPDWLRLRESADQRARSKRLLGKLAAHFAGSDAVTVFDLGAGLGSNLRGTAPALPPRQDWVLVDNDPALLSAACEEIAAWADTAWPAGNGLEASHAGIKLRLATKQHDLARDPAPWEGAHPDLITAAALFDLVSVDWIDRFVATLARAGVVFYTVLTHDGTVSWSPAHPADSAMAEAFARHFGTDKGFGPSAGGRASVFLADRLMAAGYLVERGPSPWQLGRGDHALIAAFAHGWANAVRETGAVPERMIADWATARSSDGVECTVGHEDLLAFPPR